MGKKKARVAVAHRILVIVDHMWSRRTRSAELGERVIKQRSVHAQSQRLIRQLEALGCKITGEEPADAA